MHRSCVDLMARSRIGRENGKVTELLFENSVKKYFKVISFQSKFGNLQGTKRGKTRIMTHFWAIYTENQLGKVLGALS